MRSRVFFKLVAAFLLVIAAATLTLDFTVRRSWERSLREQIETTLRQKALMFADRVAHEPNRSALQQLAFTESQLSASRVTIIGTNGVVLADSEAQPAEMENHATRPEFRAALSGQVGSDVRHSHTLGIDFLYVAAPIQDGAVRLAYPLHSIAAINHKVRMTLLGSSLLAIVVALVLAAGAARTITRRLQNIVSFAGRVEAGDLTARTEDESNDEIGQVARALDRTTRRLEESFAAIERSRREFETVLNSMQELVLAVSSDDRVQWANQRFARLVPGGIRRGATLVESVRDPDLLNAIHRALEMRQVQTAKAVSVAPGRVFLVTAAPMGAGGAVAVLTDMTEVERVERTRRNFIANVSHELRTPLTSVQGYAETVLETVEDPQIREFVEIIRKNAARMARLTEDLLILARVESGEQRFNLAPTTPAEILREAEQCFRENESANGVALEVHDDALSPVQADRDALFQVFSNLIDNALKYAREGGKIILGSRDVQGGVEFYVQDFGAGISSEHLPRLFERFYRVDKARSRESGGTGLGLSIAKHIVLAHGGSIRAESELQRGSTFVFMLPHESTA